MTTVIFEWSQLWLSSIMFYTRVCTRAISQSHLRGEVRGRRCGGRGSHEYLFCHPQPCTRNRQSKDWFILESWFAMLEKNTFTTASSSGASFFAWQRRARNEWLVMNHKAPWEGYKRQAKRLPDLVSFSWQKSLASCLLPAFLCANIFIKRETSGYEAAFTTYFLHK